MKDFLTGLAGLNKTLYFILLCLVSTLVTFASNTLLLSDDLYFQVFGDQLSYDRITEIIVFHKKWEWLSYAVVPAYYLIKIFLVAGCIYTGAIIANMDIPYEKIFHTVLFAESTFLLPGIIKLCWFTLVQTQYTWREIQLFYPLSLINFFDRDTLDTWWIYPLQLINVFEILYFLILAFGLFIATRINYARMLGLVTCTYGTGLFVWTISVMFLAISFST